jgi:hypothetical protein
MTLDGAQQGGSTTKRAAAEGNSTVGYPKPTRRSGEHNYDEEGGSSWRIQLGAIEYFRT